MIMKKILLFIGIAFFTISTGFAQCTDNGTLKNSNLGDIFYFDVIIDCDNGDVIINDAGGEGQLVFRQDVSLNSLTVNFQNGNKPIRLVIPDSVTVTVTDDIIFTGPNNKDKFLEVNGNLNVGDQLDFGGVPMEIDGTGSVSAREIINGEGVTCTQPNGDPNESCPLFSVEVCDETIGICTDEALPIELKSFTASKSGKNIDLNWVTAKEENFSHFEIERSLDQENWSQIGLVQGLGESNSDVFYDFTDRNAPFGVIYYRLKSVDIDASYEYSPVVKIEVGFEGKLAVSPNPVQDASNLKIQVPSEFRDKLAYVGLFDLNGTKVQEFRNFDAEGSLQINQQLKAGMYILKVNHNGLQENIRVVVQ
ncbi:hypothetical protein MATR_28540 [Marivirga tractuosa]|uniref:Secretion system C-terminal sorting domain-containing protein n=2 Tax=Marivirga TaxID=869806 RepID=E4TL20_MARTH|nr:hypothetical protein Ftrac_3323 [Marivirga tractuosa DSM 4126]BDD16029.1 hypothetical protein MATR_28540 [Marivirga tractuosa]